MKAKLFSILVLLLIAVLSIYLKSPGTPVANKNNIIVNRTTLSSDSLPFIIGAYDLGNLTDYTKIDSLGFNGWHWYLTKGGLEFNIAEERSEGMVFS